MFMKSALEVGMREMRMEEIQDPPFFQGHDINRVRSTGEFKCRKCKIVGNLTIHILRQACVNLRAKGN